MTVRKGLVYFLCFVLLLSFAACGKDKEVPAAGQESAQEDMADKGYPVTVGEVTLTKRPNTVVSLAASITEKIYDLGLEDRLAGVSSYCEYPAEVMDLPQCGTAQIPNINAIQDTGAQLVLAGAPLAELDTAALNERGIQVAVISGASSLEELWKSYDSIAQLLLGKDEGTAQAKATVTPAKDWLADVQQVIKKQKVDARPALYLKKLNLTVATGDTLEQELLELLGLSNIAKEQSDWFYPEVEAQSEEGKALFQTVEVLFFDTEDATIEELEQNEYYQSMPAVQQDGTLTVDTMAVERQGYSLFGEVYRMADFLWEDAGIPLWEEGTGTAAGAEVEAEETPEETDGEPDNTDAENDPAEETSK